MNGMTTSERLMKSHMIRVGQQDICAAVKPGRKDRPPLLLFNGIGANLELANPFMRAMTDVEVAIFDIPGVGGSPLPHLPYRPSTISHWAAGLVKQLGYDKIDVAGVSWGGVIAQQFAHQFPVVCRKLILAATTPGAIMVPGRVSVLLKMATPRRYVDKQYMRKIASDIYGGVFRDDPDLIWAHANSMNSSSDLGYLYQLLAVAGWTSLPWLHTLKQPTLVLMGNDDPIVPPINGQVLARLIRGARLQTMECGHLFFVTRPQETALHVQSFLAEE